MKTIHGRRLVALAATSLALVLAGCSGSANTCKSNTDCKNGQMCGSAGKCVADPCASKTCPGHMTCDSSTGKCGGTCCLAGDCTDPRTQCDQTACASGGNACAQKTCGSGANLGCPAKFTCNQVANPPACEATCLTQGCTQPNEMCDATTGDCVVRPPQNGEVGTTCTKASDCASGFTCNTNIPGGYCTKNCTTDTDCPQGSFCPTGGGVCLDACDPAIGDCLRGMQCVTGAFGANKPGACFPVLTQSNCTANCLPNGSPCTQTSQCMKDSSCIGYGPNLKMCQSIQCQLFGQACDTGQTCQSLGQGITACFNDCDPTNLSACSSLADQYGSLQCVPQPQIAGPTDGYWLAAKTSDCHSGETAKAISVGSQNAAVCYRACSTDADCGPGQFCGDNSVTLTSGTTVATFKTCMNYNIIANKSCSDTPNPCANQTGCTDLNASGQKAAVCYNKCTSDADCTKAFGGTCQRITFLTGDSMQVCLYKTSGSFCFGGCATNADCGYCNSDADCGTTTGKDGTTEAKKCDVTSHMCMVPINGVAQVGNWCRSNEAYDATAITDGSGNKSGACVVPCNDDLDCPGTCVTNTGAPSGFTGFCAPQTQLCNGPTGQCEDTCSGAGAGATDCIQGTCAAADGPNGENRCVLACAAAGDNCATGVCDTTAKYCVDDPTITKLTLGGKDAIASATIAVVKGAEPLVWATTHATSTKFESAAVPATGGCGAVTSWTAVTGFTGTPSGNMSIQVSAKSCYRLTAIGPASQVTQVFEVDLAP